MVIFLLSLFMLAVLTFTIAAQLLKTYFPGDRMNRKKKINETLKKKLKKANAKLHNSNKPKYIAKAEREKLALAAKEHEAKEAKPVETGNQA